MGENLKTVNQKLCWFSKWGAGSAGVITAQNTE